MTNAIKMNFNYEEWKALNPSEQAAHLHNSVFMLHLNGVITNEEALNINVEIHKRTMGLLQLQGKEEKDA